MNQLKITTEKSLPEGGLALDGQWQDANPQLAKSIRDSLKKDDFLLSNEAFGTLFPSQHGLLHNFWLTRRSDGRVLYAEHMKNKFNELRLELKILPKGSTDAWGNDFEEAYDFILKTNRQFVKYAHLPLITEASAIYTDRSQSSDKSQSGAIKEEMQTLEFSVQAQIGAFASLLSFKAPGASDSVLGSWVKKLEKQWGIDKEIGDFVGGLYCVGAMISRAGGSFEGAMRVLTAQSNQDIVAQMKVRSHWGGVFFDLSRPKGQGIAVALNLFPFNAWRVDLAARSKELDEMPYTQAKVQIKDPKSGLFQTHLHAQYSHAFWYVFVDRVLDLITDPTLKAKWEEFFIHAKTMSSSIQKNAANTLKSSTRDFLSLPFNEQEQINKYTHFEKVSEAYFRSCENQMEYLTPIVARAVKSHLKHLAPPLSQESVSMKDQITIHTIEQAAKSYFQLSCSCCGSPSGRAVSVGGYLTRACDTCLEAHKDINAKVAAGSESASSTIFLRTPSFTHLQSEVLGMAHMYLQSGSGGFGFPGSNGESIWMKSITPVLGSALDKGDIQSVVESMSMRRTLGVLATDKEQLIFWCQSAPKELVNPIHKNGTHPEESPPTLLHLRLPLWMFDCLLGELPWSGEQIESAMRALKSATSDSTGLRVALLEQCLLKNTIDSPIVTSGSVSLLSSGEQAEKSEDRVVPSAQIRPKSI